MVVHFSPFFARVPGLKYEQFTGNHSLPGNEMVRPAGIGHWMGNDGELILQTKGG